MTRHYGRAPRGERCRLLVPQGHYKTTTVIAALRTTGPCAHDLVDDATNGTMVPGFQFENCQELMEPRNRLARR